MSPRKLAIACVFVLAVVALPLSASAAPVDDAVSTFTYTKNLHPLGFSERAVPAENATPGQGVFNSDLAFWGKRAYQGTYNGFRIIDVSDPENPVEIVKYENCVSPTSTNGSQGDVVVWGDVLVRSWDAPRNVADPALRTCGEIVTPQNQEGVHIFDISDPAHPVAVKFVQTPCGSHTATGVPDLENNRLLIYNSASSGAANCRGIDILEVPLDDPASASFLRFEPSGTPLVGLPNLVTVDAPLVGGRHVRGQCLELASRSDRRRSVRPDRARERRCESAAFPTATSDAGLRPAGRLPGRRDRTDRSRDVHVPRQGPQRRGR